MSMPHCKDVIVCNLYRPPKGKLDKCLSYLETNLSEINTNKVDVFLMGDLNVNYLDKRNPDYKKVAFFIKSNQMTQYILESTRVTKNTSTALDLAISNCKHVSQSGTLPIHISDHQPIYIIKKKTRDQRPRETFTGRTYRHLIEEDLQRHLRGIDWDLKMDTTTAEAAWRTMYTEIKSEVDRICPIKKFTVRSQRPEWITNNLLEQMKDRDYFYRKAKKTGLEDDWNIAKHLRNTTNFNIRQAKSNYIINKLETHKDDPKKFWRTIKRVFPSKTKKEKSQITLKNKEGDTVCSKEVPEYINDFFVNIGTTIARDNSKNNTRNTRAQDSNNADGNGVPVVPITTPIADPYPDDTQHEIAEVTENEVYREVMKINIGKSSGLSEINSRVLKMAFKMLIPQLTVICNLSVKSTTYPDDWKKAIVVPIPKTGDLQEVGNYRPISLLPLPGKILERLIYNQITASLEEENFFTTFQHGFRKKHSTIHAILQLTNHINYNMDKGIPTAAVFIDFRKAFDCVCHTTFLKKLESTQLGPNMVCWVKDYLRNRQQAVLANNVKSSNLQVQQGVPQGSILGPLFYIIYANDIPENMKSNIALYADDTVLYTSSRNGNKVKDTLQEDMDTLGQWCMTNGLTINADKTKVMVFGNKKRRENLGDQNIAFEGKDIKTVTAYKYLGVKLDQSLKYDLHANAIIQRVSDKVNYLRRIRKFVNRQAALSIYKNMILPILEYGNVLMFSVKSDYRKKMQVLQNKGLKCALGLDPLTSTKEVHKEAKLDPLHIRRKQHILQTMFKQVHEPFLWKLKKARKSGVVTRSCKKKQFIIKRIKTEKLKKSVTNKAPRLWNSLPKGLQNATDPNYFKFKLKEHLTRGRREGQIIPNDV